MLGEKPAVKKDMWIKRAKEYEKNINSGDPVLNSRGGKGSYIKKMTHSSNNHILRDKFI